MSPDGTRHIPLATRPGESLVLGISLMLIAFNLRIAVTGLGPLLPEAMRATALPPLGASLLTTLPTLCFGLFGPLAPWLASRFGAERAVLAMLLLLALGCALRGLGDAGALFAGQALASVAIGVSNVLLPGLVKRDFPHRAALMTGLFTMSLCVGAALAAAAAAPARLLLGGSWSASLASSALPALLAAALWWRCLPVSREQTVPLPAAARALWRQPLAWHVTLFMGLQSAMAYIVFAWLAPLLRDRGMSAAEAGLLLSLTVLAQAPAALVAPWLATRGRDQRLASVTSLAICVGGWWGCAFAPLGIAWIGAVALGAGQGAVFAIGLMLFVLRAADARDTARLSGMAQGVGYLLASLGPLLAGLLHGWSGEWRPIAWLFAAIGLLAALSGLAAGRVGQVHG